MPVTFFSEEDQQNALDDHNKAKGRMEKIPLVNRNAQTGWPLFQVSLFTPSAADTRKYEHALGGGKCHFFCIGAFNLASLMAKIPGKMTVTGNYHQEKDRRDLKIDNVAMFLEDFSVHHHVLGFKINSESGGYGKTLEVTCPEGDPDKLKNVLWEQFSFALKPQSHITAIGAWKDSPSLSKEEIQEKINEDVAVFSGGQIFVDLGEFLEQQVKDPAIKEYFKTIFKVDEFIALQKANTEFKPVESKRDEYAAAKANTESTPAPDVALAQADSKQVSPSLVNLYYKIKLMRDYGTSLFNKDSQKSTAAVTLANKLEEELDAFNKQVLKTQPEKKDVEQFQSQFRTLLHSQDEIMSEHRAIWKPIVKNILFSLGTAGIGLLAIGIKAGISIYRNYQSGAAITVSNTLFFAQTRREKNIESIENEMTFDDKAPFSPPK